MYILILIVGIAGFVYSIILHEIAHGLVAERLGDPTARLSNRLTLNPISHIDLLGSIILPLILILLRSPLLFGWAKPVPVDPYNLKNPKKDMALISVAGPLTNITLAVLLSIFLRILMVLFANTAIFTLFFYLIAFNIAIAIFNLIPVNPLDGGKVASGILPDKEAREFSSFLNRFGLILLLLLIFPIFGGRSIITMIFNPILNFFLKILIPGFSTI